MKSISLDQLKSKLQEWLSGNNYSENTIKGYMYEISQLENLMKEEGISEYSEPIGIIYQSRRECDSFKPKTRAKIARSILVWDLLLNDLNIPCCRSDPNKWEEIPFVFKAVVQSYIADSKARCNKHSSLEQKERVCSYFFKILSDLGCSSCDQMEANTILRAILSSKPSWWRIIKCILCHMYDEGFTKLDFSGLVPKNRTVLKIPSVYTKEEIEQAEGTFDLNTDVGKRNLAIFKMASREALRSLDIAELKKSSIDFESNHLLIRQSKTDEDLDLPLFPDVKDALMDYLDNGRPPSDSEYVFLQARAPYMHLSRQHIYKIISTAIVGAGINVEGKHRGGHSLRASSATLKINSGMRYEQVQKSLGHSGRESIKHYAALDVNCLRKCALTPPTVDEESTFGRFLRGMMI